MRVGIVGTGSTYGIADRHVEAFLRIPQVQIAAVYTRREEQGRKFVKKHRLNAVVCRSYPELLEKVDGVCICSPNSSHIPYVLEALRAEKGVLCEKPLGESKAELEELLAAVGRRSIGQTIGFNYRYSWENRCLRELRENGRLGRLYTYYQRKGGNRLAQEAVPYEWRMDKSISGLGSATDFGAHMLDNFLVIGGFQPEEIEDVHLQSEIFIKKRRDSEGKEREVSTDDTAILTVCMKGGSRAVLDSSRVGITFEEIQIIGSRGMAFYTQAEPDRLYVWEKNEEGFLVNKPQKIFRPQGEEMDTYYLQACDWVRAVMGKRVSACTISFACREELAIREKLIID